MINRLSICFQRSLLRKKNISVNELINEIQLSINEIGFNNTANIYSISDSSKLGGKWMD